MLPKFERVPPEFMVIVPPLVVRVLQHSIVSESPLFSVRDMFVTVHMLAAEFQLGLPEGRDWHDA